MDTFARQGSGVSMIELVALDMSHKKDIAAWSRHTNRLEQKAAANEQLLINTIHQLRAELTAERARRMAAELRLERILDMPV